MWERGSAENIWDRGSTGSAHQLEIVKQLVFSRTTKPHLNGFLSKPSDRLPIAPFQFKKGEY
jgi:hypothetical protein